MKRDFMTVLIVLASSLILLHYLKKHYQAKQAELANQVPVDTLGIVIEPNTVTMRDTMAEIENVI